MAERWQNEELLFHPLWVLVVNFTWKLEISVSPNGEVKGTLNSGNRPLNKEFQFDRWY